MEHVTIEVRAAHARTGEQVGRSSCALTAQAAWVLAQFLKRMGFAEARACAASEAEAYEIIHATEALRAALAGAGYAPR